MLRLAARHAKVVGDLHPMSPAETSELAGFGPAISLERGYLTLRWEKDQFGSAGFCRHDAGAGLSKALGSATRSH